MFLRDALLALVRARVRFCVVGGVAVNLHGVPRMTYDLDVVPDPSLDNLERLERVLTGLGLQPRLPIALVTLADPAERARLLDERNLRALTFSDPSDPLREIDVLVSPGADPAALVAGAVRMTLGDVSVPVIALADLIALKRGAGRPQDVDDADLLERLDGAARRG